MLTVIFISYSKAVFPIEIDIAADKSGASDDESKEDYVNMMSGFRDSLFADVQSNIVHAQLRQKEDYDKKHGKKKVYSYNFISSLSCNTQCKGEGDEGDKGIQYLLQRVSVAIQSGNIHSAGHYHLASPLTDYF